MKLDLNIHINSWLNKEVNIIDPVLLQLKDNSISMIVDTDEKIFIEFDYPLSHSVIIGFDYPRAMLTRKGKKPWRLADLIDCIAQGYVKIYDEEDETRTLPATTMGTGLINRPTTDGKHGIWGHILNDLFIERVYKKNGIWQLWIGS